MITGKRTFTMSTKLHAKAPAKSTIVTVDFTDATDDQVVDLAIRQLKVDIQQQFRGTDKKPGFIPDKFEYVVKDRGVSRGVIIPTVDGTKAQYEALSEEDKKAFRAKLGIVE